MANEPQPRTATLASIAAAVAEHQEVVRVGEDVEVVEVYIDSRAVTAGSLYVAIRGANNDGHDFIEAAIAAGAAGAVVEQPPRIAIPYLLVEDTRAALGWAAADVFDFPARRLGLVGITGTNGKTTVAHMLAAMIDGPARSAAVIGTVSANLPDGLFGETSPRTTPEANALHRALHRLATGGQITDVAVEVSSHAMTMGRINAVEFDVVAFTNLSHDHLDYHLTMDAYYRAKARLFESGSAPRGVIWTDDPWGQRLRREAEIPVTTVGTASECDVVVRYGEDSLSGSDFSITLAGQRFEVRTPLAGRFNVANGAIALTCAHLQGIDPTDAVGRLEALTPIAGRYNAVATDRDIWVIVDYAHTADAIARVIAETRSLTSGRIIAVAGAGGDRDQEKRPSMGRALAEADVAIVTTDNPRSEDPELIAQQVLSGIEDQANVALEPDRRLAIRQALATSAGGDVVLILGKGHETIQEFADGAIPFDDSEVAAEELARSSGRLV